MEPSCPSYSDSVKQLLERELELAAVDELLTRRGAALLIEGGMGVGKTSLWEEACRRANGLGHQVLRARGSELERAFAFGVVRQLFERRVAAAPAAERDALLAGPASAVRPLLLGEAVETSVFDTSFAVLHGLYWLTANLADSRPLVIAVDDGHWADEPSLRWLAHLASRLEGLAVAVVVTLRPVEPESGRAWLEALRAEAPGAARPQLLSEGAVAALVRDDLGARASDELCAAICEASGGNPLFVTELLRAAKLRGGTVDGSDPARLVAAGGETVGRQVLAAVRRLDPYALGLAQALALLGDGCQLRHAAAVSGLEMEESMSLAAGLVRVGVLAADDPPRFTHPIVRAALERSLATDERDAGHRRAARVLHAEGAPPGQVAAHLVEVRPAADAWVLARLRSAAQAAMQTGAPRAAADLLGRALEEPPPLAERVDVLREAARAEATAGSGTAGVQLEEALDLARGRGGGRRSHARWRRCTPPCFGGKTPSTSSSGRSANWATPTKRLPHGWRASWWSVECMTPAEHRG